jgi:malonyl-CoA decarboxylase
MSTRFFQDMLGSIAERGRQLIDRSPGRNAAKASRKISETSADSIEELSRALLSGKGEASGVALARQLLDLYAGLPVSDRIKFFKLLGRDFGPDLPALRLAWNEYDKNPSPKKLSELLRAVEPPRQELSPEPGARRHRRTRPDAPRSCRARRQGRRARQRGR